MDGNLTDDPRATIVWRGNYLNQAKGNEQIIEKLLLKLDLVVDLNFRMDTTALYSDYVLPAATAYEKYDLNSTDLHRFIHPFTPAVPPMFEAKSDWQAFQSLTEKLAERARARGFTRFTDDEVVEGVEGMQSTMPSYECRLSDAELDALVQFPQGINGADD